MPAQINGSAVPASIPIRIDPSNRSNGVAKHHKHSRSSYSESSPLSTSRNNSVTFRPPKRLMSTPNKTIAVINAAGRQAASLIRNATAVGYHVRAQLRNLEGVVATEVATNPNVTVIVGELYTRHEPSEDNKDVTRSGPITGVGVNHDLISILFQGAQLAFINTTFYGDELQIGKAVADAAQKAGVQHFIYSSMPDHATYNPDWPSLPLWCNKHEVEEYIRGLDLPATFVYTGIYNNNFTSLNYPLFCMELQSDGSFVWQAPFHEDAKLPWLDAEHDVGPAILQIFKDGVSKWRRERIPLAYEYLSPREACEVFGRGLGRPVRYVRGPIEVKVRVPAGYQDHLDALQKLFRPDEPDAKKQPPYFGDIELERQGCAQALELWEGPRGLEEYAREMFPLEEEANGLTWMFDDEDEEYEAETETQARAQAQAEAEKYAEEVRATTNSVEQLQIREDEDEDEDEGLIMRARKRDEEEWLA
ncbi:Nucleoside-diphosphate-sugar epimerase [Geosmithia morbida]|uniref:Nucleoside-diphosphate-sugar epimerase n=1 Tax=Geosmithia morbida TaxID=1094350 RepID=A0A9P4YRS1_9HYPO|nr:Nucleoside-diphosphate-sugar epimerase [Geosmithia morbida]KAF4120431.1 Nucleoside-diphosphate-sugar epimerase [Geosmithia morbida]